MDDESNVLLGTKIGARPPRSLLAIASFVSGCLTLAGLVFGSVVPGMVYAFLFFVPAIVTGHLARRGFRKDGQAHRDERFATFGLSTGYLGLFLSIFVVSMMVFRLG